MKTKILADFQIRISVPLMCKSKPFLDKDSLLSLYFSHVHSFINYANLAWAIHSQQKQALIIVYNKDRYYHTKELF